MFNLLTMAIDDSRDHARATQLAGRTLTKICTGFTGDADVRHFFSSIGTDMTSMALHKQRIGSIRTAVGASARGHAATAWSASMTMNRSAAHPRRGASQL